MKGYKFSSAIIKREPTQWINYSKTLMITKIKEKKKR
jgi:hypothetical protein